MESTKPGNISVPEPGTLVSGLLTFLEGAQQGEVPPEAVGEIAAEMKIRILALLDSVLAGIKPPLSPPAEFQSFVANIQERLGEIRAIFHMTLDEVARYSQDNDPAHLSLGLSGARAAERAFFSLIALLKERTDEFKTGQ